MTTLALLLVFPLTWPFIAKLIWKTEITAIEIGINVGIGVIIVIAGWFAGRYAMVADVEVLNGQVISKHSDEVSCTHSYRCRCKTTCSTVNGVKKCTETCDTCYEHAFDVDWILETTLGRIRINRIDRQGVEEPPRYTEAKVGDPVAKTSLYTNYIKGAPDSLFNALNEEQLIERFKNSLPAYPENVYDYHYVDRVLANGVSINNLREWNLELAKRLRTLGPAKEVNFVVVFTKEADPQYANALNAHWLGGKKNDVIVVLGTPNYPEIAWVQVLSWSKEEVFKVKLRDALQDMGRVELQTFFDTLVQHVSKGYVRRPMSDFEYLKHEIEPPTWVIVLLVVLSATASIGCSILVAKNNVRCRRYTSRR